MYVEKYNKMKPHGTHFEPRGFFVKEEVYIYSSSAARAASISSEKSAVVKTF